MQQPGETPYEKKRWRAQRVVADIQPPASKGHVGDVVPRRSVPRLGSAVDTGAARQRDAGNTHVSRKSGAVAEVSDVSLLPPRSRSKTPVKTLKSSGRLPVKRFPRSPRDVRPVRAPRAGS
jgi:hypothetical protein